MCPGEASVQYALALEVPEQVAAAIQPLRERYAHGPLLPPHLTLLYPFVLLAPERQVTELIAHALAETPAITASLGEVRRFDASHTVYIEVEEGGAAARLFQALLAGLSGMIGSDRAEYARFARDGYLPHLTITDEVPTATYRRAWGLLSGRSFAGASFSLEAAVLYRLDGHDWHPVARFPLGTAPSAGR